MSLNPIEVQEFAKQAVVSGLTYADYRILVAKHAASFTSTGHTQSEALSNYTVLNDKRMKRWDKTLRLTQDQELQIETFNRPLNWLVLSESWCGDAPPALAVMNRIAEVQPAINFKVILRDDHPQLMDAFLTNGAMSIPKLIIQDSITQEILTSWGSRSAPAQKLVDDKAKYGEIKPSFKEELQLWYNKDKGMSILSELLLILSALNLETQKL
ncbi:thioredoxin family protein [Leeuwenhoekiella sp. MAR_2009_132]|uniref:thioredoxin family protein n=1 Tax=Leeuwenhoekiella sp. MAR_2009_132 TaxID=1392489 RepID=UPI00048E4BEA|nr:thioredoxin family protein [Leeuwenhoekiella sp. MAR_2009_132]